MLIGLVVLVFILWVIAMCIAYIWAVVYFTSRRRPPPPMSYVIESSYQPPPDPDAVFAKLRDDLSKLGTVTGPPRPAYVPPAAVRPEPEPQPKAQPKPQPRRTAPAPDYLPRWSFSRRMETAREDAHWQEEFDR